MTEHHHSGEAYAAPEHPTNYVAYAKEPSRVGNADTGEATDFRPSLFVREYPSILVKGFTRKQGEYKGETFQFASVKFDAASAGMSGFKQDFGASIEAAGPACDLLEQAYNQNKPVRVVVETVRRTRNADTGDPISPLTYIHDLRGAQADGKRGNANQTGQTCKNIVAGVGAAGNGSSFVLTSEVQSDPAEWAVLRTNRDHTLPPTGWRVHEGGIIPTGTASATGAAVDADDVASRVAAILKPIMSGTTTDRPRPKAQESHSVEAKPWEPWNSDGRVNLGGYLMVAERALFDEAVRLVASVDQPGEVLQSAWRLVPVLRGMADAVQVNTYGSGARPDRGAKSHVEASKWVSWVYTTLATVPGFEHLAFTQDVLDGDMDAWAQNVVTQASQLFTQAAGSVESYLGAPTDATEGASSTSQTTTAEPPQKSQSDQDESPSQPEPHTEPEPETASLDEWATTASNPAAKERYEALLNRAGQAAHPERFHPLLIERFGAWTLADIPLTDFEKALDEWDRDDDAVSAFVNEAFQAWQTQANSQQTATSGDSNAE